MVDLRIKEYNALLSPNFISEEFSLVRIFFLLILLTGYKQVLLI